MSDYEQVRGERGRANILNHLAATQIHVQSAIEYARHTLAVMRDDAGVHEVEQAIVQLQDAGSWLSDAQGKNGEHVDNLSTLT